MGLRIYNTLSGKKEDFVPVEEGKVKMYVCGMTVYSDAHLGHARTYIAFDIIRRYLEYKGYKVTYVQNITDVDDKIIRSAREKGMDPLEYSRYYTERCLSDLSALGIREADIYPKASEHIDDMIEMIQKIIENGYGYVSDGDVYFSVDRFADYGKLSKQRIEDMKAGARIEPSEKKRNPLDFALWKSAKPDEPKWKSPWGEGRPGWHIECSAMSIKYLGVPFDIHGGGRDLIFPHHENEIAQAEAAYGKGFARYWLHTGLLKIRGEKMSKSLGNIISVREAIKKYNPEAIRFFFASTHYRSPPNFTEEAIEHARRSLEKIYRIYDILGYFERKGGEEEDEEVNSLVEELKKEFEEAMDDDFNTPMALKAIFRFIDRLNNKIKVSGIASRPSKLARETLLKLCNVLTLLQDVKEEEIDMDEVVGLLEKYGIEKRIRSPEEGIDALIELRDSARRERDWVKADSIREDLRRLGLEVEDTKMGTIWYRKRKL
ncbi:MAG: cysteine--tRNA ligase [Thermoplasmata archaeon]|nr:MAG: cysteine--tRNA ligase [Thermoplasmata archaeon]